MHENKFITVLTIIRYPGWAIPFALMSMAIFRLPLSLNKKIGFWKLMGSGRNGTFDKTPDWRQWAIMTVGNEAEAALAMQGNEPNKIAPLYGKFIGAWLRIFKCTCTIFVLQPIEGHGKWDGQECFGPLAPKSDYAGEIAVLTRATIRMSRLKSFWANVGAVAEQMTTAEGFVQSYGIGEIPWIKQATFSIWESKESMKNFAYKMHDHTEVIRKTRQERWYSEDMFVRFRILRRMVS